EYPPRGRRKAERQGTPSCRRAAASPKHSTAVRAGRQRRGRRLLGRRSAVLLGRLPGGRRGLGSAGERSSMKTAFITGASTGIGHASAIHLSRHGFLVFAGVRKELDAQRLAKEGGDRIVTINVDVTDRNSIRAAVDQVRPRLDRRGLDALVNNAGIGITGPVEHVTLEDLRRMFDVNVFGQIAVTQAFLPLIRQ